MRLILVEDHLVYRQSLRLALELSGQFRIVGEAARARDAYDLVEHVQADLIVVDFLLPDTDAVSFAYELRRRRVRPRLLVLSRMAHPMFVTGALRAGAAGFALKGESLESLMAAMRQAAGGTRYLSPEIGSRLEDPEQQRRSLFDSLSLREREVLCHLIEGMSSKEIARELFLSPKTVDAHRLHINRKLGVRSPSELARLVADTGLFAV
jgi:DNA-binding NarL/FixJ family response regulator